MNVAILLKSGPDTDEAARCLQTAEDMLAEGSTVGLFLLQEAVRFCQPRTESPNHEKMKNLIANNLSVNVMAPDAALRGIDLSAADSALQAGSYETLVDRVVACDRVVGIL